MAGSKSVLYFGKLSQNKLTEKLFKLGVIPLFRDNILQAIYTLRHGSFEAVLVDAGSVDADVLEFILNVRDIDQQIPVFVAGESPDIAANRVISDLKNTFLLPEHSRKMENLLQGYN